MENSKPFSRNYVLRTTAKHMRKSVDISIQKTLARTTDFVDDPVKSLEVFDTLSKLNAMRKQIDEFQTAFND
jgi:hypothetical protein